MATVKITLIPVINSKYFDRFINEHDTDEKLKNHSFIDKFEWIKKRHLLYVIEQLDGFEPSLKFKIKKGIIEFETNKPCDDLRILFDHYIMNEVENIEIVRG